jgi:hypothetical protein
MIRIGAKFSNIDGKKYAKGFFRDVCLSVFGKCRKNVDPPMFLRSSFADPIVPQTEEEPFYSVGIREAYRFLMLVSRLCI